MTTVTVRYISDDVATLKDGIARIIAYGDAVAGGAAL